MNLLSIFSEKVFAQSNIVGIINTPFGANSFGNIDNPSGGLGLFIGNALRLFFVVAGILALFNFVLAGFQYMTASGDSKALQEAWSRIWLSLVGLVIIVASFAFAALFGHLILGDALFMLRPTIYAPR